MYIYVQTPLVLPRWIASVPLALLLTFSLFLMMVQLSFNEMEEPSEPPEVIYDPIYEPKILETMPALEPIDKPKVNDAPPLPDSSVDNTDNTLIPNLAVNHIVSDNEFSLKFTGMPIAQYLVQPRYPSRAATRGIEGYVDVKFDISQIGTTENISVLAASPSGYFEKSAVEAVKRWRYQPQVEEGQAQKFIGMTKRIRFQMEQ